MRSARTVSSVIRMTLGRSVATVDSAGNKTNRQRIEARRIKERGVSIVADSFLGTKTWSRRSENELRSDLPGAGAALRKKRVAGSDIRRLPVRGEARARGLRADREIIEVRMVQQVGDLKAELEAQLFRDLGGLDDVKIPLCEFGSAHTVAAAGPDGVRGRIGIDCGRIRDGGTIGVAELVNRFYSRTVWPLVNQVLAGFVGGAAQQWGPGTASRSRHHRPELPTLSKASCGMPARNVVDHASIEVQPDICVARSHVTVGIVRILHDRKCRRTSATHGIRVNTVRLREIHRGIEPMPVALA